MKRLRLVIQKKGRLRDESINLLQRAGLLFRIQPNALITSVENFPIDLLFVRDDDIPTLVFDQLCDGGIVGRNVLAEASLANPEKQYQEVIGLKNCRCRLVIAVPEKFNYEGPGSLEGKRIATSYPALLNDYLTKNKIKAESLFLSGSVEVAPRMNMADTICDLVSTGQTLEENKLIEVENILESEAIFIRSTEFFTEEQETIFNLLQRRIEAVQQALTRKYIVFHAPIEGLNEICKNLPGAESPTVVPLEAYKDRVAVHTVSSEGVFWNTLETIQSLGASSILVLPIEKMLE